MSELQDYAGQCYICKKHLFFGDESYLWHYHASVGFVCRDHPGVKEWYTALLNEAFAPLKSSDDDAVFLGSGVP
jgi:hypothetical protein